MADIMRSFRARMLALFAASMGIAGAITFLMYKALQQYYRSRVKLEDPLADVRDFVKEIGDLNFFLLLFVPLSVLFFFLLTKRYADYFRDISVGIRRLASGDFQHRVVIASGDEFGAIARDLNQAGETLQEAMKRGDFAESSKDRLVLNLAHDLRTPLTSVIGYLDFIVQDRGLTAERVEQYAAIALNKSRRLERLIDELFEIAGMNYATKSADRQAIDLGELLIQVIELLYPAMEKHDLTAKTTLAPGLTIEGDGAQLARVFENVLTNAVRYGKDGRFVEVIGAVEGEHATVQVVNYGDPIPEADLPYVFDMFYTGDRARTHRDGGTGLGLYIAKQIVERHRGTIAVRSDALRTAFEVRLPLAPAASEASAVAGADDRPGRV